MPLRQSFGGFLYYAYSRHKHIGRYNSKTCNFPVLLNEGENCFLEKGIYSSKGAYLGVKKENMKVNLLVEFNREKYNLNYKSHIYRIKTSTNTHRKVFIRF